MLRVKAPLMVGLFSCLTATTAVVADPLPAEKYAEIPPATAVRLSPDGARLALALPGKEQALLVIHQLKDGKDNLVNLGKFQLSWVQWKSPTRLIASVRTSTNALFFGQDDESNVTRLFALDADGTNSRNIGEPPDGFNIGEANAPVLIHPQYQDWLASLLPDDPHHILQTVLDQVPYRDRKVWPAVWQVDVDTGRRSRLVLPHPDIWEFKADQSGTVRLGVGLSGTTRTHYVRDVGSDEWRVFQQSDIHRDPPFEVLGFVPGAPSTVYVATTDKNGQGGLWTFDTVSRALTLVDATASPSAHIIERNDRLMGYATADGSWKYLDPAWQHDYDVVRRAIPKMEVELVDRSEDGIKTLVIAAEPHGPKSWWILNRQTKPAQLSSVLDTYPAIGEAGIAPVRKVTYTSRDGLSIDAWLTLPKSAGNAPVPFVVLPHGGPHTCENGDFDYLAQFLASRGYGVLQPQFRGSTCKGSEFERLGYRQWGLAMQDDLTDGTHWLIQQKLTDPARICIVGASYGGYAALEGVAKEPDLYRCAAAWAPVTDLAKMVSEAKRYHVNAESEIAPIGTDPDALKSVSPALHADRIRVPVLLVHGKSDFTVQVWQSEEMEEALKDAHKNVEAIYLDNSDHYMDTFAARLAWLKALEKFLATNLGPGKS